MIIAYFGLGSPINNAYAILDTVDDVVAVENLLKKPVLQIHEYKRGMKLASRFKWNLIELE